MIFFLFFSCSEPIRATLPERRKPSPVLNQRVQYGKLKGNLFSRGQNATEGFVVVEKSLIAQDCIHNHIKENQRILVIDPLQSNEIALKYLKQNVSGKIKVVELDVICPEVP